MMMIVVVVDRLVGLEILQFESDCRCKELYEVQQVVSIVRKMMVMMIMMMITTMVMMMTTIMAMMKSMCIGGERLTFQSEFKLFPLISTQSPLCTLHCTLCTASCTVKFSVHTVHCCTVKCTVHRALYIVSCEMRTALS